MIEKKDQAHVHVAAEKIEILKPGEAEKLAQERTEAAVDLDLPEIPEEHEKRTRRGRKPKQKKKPPIEDELLLKDLVIPIGMLTTQLTALLAAWRKDERYLMSDRELINWEKSFNWWVRYRLPWLKVIFPELIGFMPLISYLIRIVNIREKS